MPRFRVLDVIAAALVALLVCDGLAIAARGRGGDPCRDRYWHFTRTDVIDTTVEVQLHSCVHLDYRARTATVSTRVRARRSGDLDLEPVLRRAYVHVGVTTEQGHAVATCADPALTHTTGEEADRLQRRGGSFAGYGTLVCRVSAAYTSGDVTVAVNPLVDVVDDGADLLGSPYVFQVRGRSSRRGVSS